MVGKASLNDDLINHLKKLTHFLTVNQVAELLSLHPETIYRLIEFQGLPATKIGGRWKIDPRRLGDWLTERSS